MNTRIKKFSVLRNKVEQEIKTLKLQEDNLKKIKEYKAKINEINAKIFAQSNKVAGEIFPDLTSLIHVEREHARADLKRIQKEVTKWSQKVEKTINKNKEKKLEVSDFIPEYENENLIKQQIKLTKEEEAKFNETFIEITKKKKEILEKAKKINEAEFEQIKILNEVKENNNYIENKLVSVNFWIKFKKQKTIWIFWLCLVVILGLISCLVILLTK